MIRSVRGASGLGPRASRRPRDVAEELGDVAGGGHACFVQHVAGGLGDGEAVDVADPGLPPQAADDGGGAGLA